MQQRTVVAVAHRLSTLAQFDRVLVLQEGRIVEDGSPAELRQQQGLFSSLWRMQAGGFAPDGARQGEKREPVRGGTAAAGWSQQAS
jgi:ATP-binding cassette subfamily B protein